MLHPSGVLIEAENLSQALADTAEELARKRRRPMFEATFQAGGVLVRVDLLLPARGGYRLVEVKSSTSVKPYHLEDASVQAWVARQAGLPVTKVELAHVDNRFIYSGGNHYAGLFAHVDVSAEVKAREKDVPKWIGGAQKILADKEPKVEPGSQCADPFECPFLAHCAPVPESERNGYPPEILPRGAAIAAELRAEGYNDLRKVPKGRLTNATHVRIWQATKRGKAELNARAGAELRALPFPRYFLDFETLAPAVPIWAGTRPYAQVPFQWSCHVQSRSGELRQHAFLAPNADDPRQGFAKSLLRVLRNRGPILVYNAGFERSRMQELAAAFPDLAEALGAAIARIVDLLPLAREYYYHPKMRGSWSIKAVLPTIAPELSYGNLTVADGGMAQQAFAEIIHPDTPEERCNLLRKDLLAYCERDTLAMVKVAQFFQKG
jgi:hypothetical protein